MGHWLDDAARGLASGRVSRRDALRRGGAVAAGALLSSLPGSSVAFAAGSPCGQFNHTLFNCCYALTGSPIPTAYHLCPKGDLCCGADGCCGRHGSCCPDKHLHKFGSSSRCYYPDEGDDCCHNEEGRAYVCRGECCPIGGSDLCCERHEKDHKCCFAAPTRTGGCYDPKTESCCLRHDKAVARICGKGEACCDGECCAKGEECCGSGASSYCVPKGQCKPCNPYYGSGNYYPCPTGEHNCCYDHTRRTTDPGVCCKGTCCGNNGNVCCDEGLNLCCCFNGAHNPANFCCGCFSGP